MPTTLRYTDTLQILECGACHITFAMPVQLYNQVRKSGEWFWCPTGCRIHYYETENAQLKKAAEVAERRLASTRATLDQVRAERDHQEARVRGYQGALAKTKQRAAAGVCPVAGCKRSFADVARHVKNQHPEFPTTTSEKVVVH